MPRCTGCGNELPASSRFCSICGKQLSAGASATPTMRPNPASPAAAVPPANNNGRIAAIAGGILILLALAGLALKMSGVLSAKPTQAPPAAVLNAPDTQVVAAPVLNAPQVAAPSAPVLQAPGNPGQPMPEDIIDYLRWLKRFEAARHQLEAQEESQLQVVAVEAMKEFATGANSLGTLDDDPGAGAAGGTANQAGEAGKGLDFSQVDQTVQQWNKVAGIFQAKTPPNPCAPLATAYNGAITTGVQQMTGIVSSFRSALSSLRSNNGQSTPDVTGTLTALESEKNGHQGSNSIDSQFSSANNELDSVRSRYTNIPDDINHANFQISESGGGSGGLGLGLGF